MSSNIASAQQSVSHERQVSSSVLTRNLIEKDGVNEIAAVDSPGLKLITDAGRAASISKMLSARPRGDVWVFGYGSLIWNPAIESVERRLARVDGWHRSFCLSITALRATVENPGLTLALDRGGACYGAAYKVAEADVERELNLLWKREMVCDGYVPHWIELKSIDGEVFDWAITFTIDAKSPNYAGNFEEDAVVYRLATASGGLGSSADYLYRTCQSLRVIGIRDTRLERLALRVSAYQEAGRCSSRV